MIKLIVLLACEIAVILGVVGFMFGAMVKEDWPGLYLGFQIAVWVTGVGAVVAVGYLAILFSFWKTI